jgi:hypothetical protein
MLEINTQTGLIKSGQANFIASVLIRPNPLNLLNNRN